MKTTHQNRRVINEAQFGQLMRHAMNDSAQAVPEDVTEKLRIARRKALDVRKQAAQTAGVFGFIQSCFGFMSARLVLAAPALVLGVGLYIMSEHNAENYTQSLAELDSQVLTQEVPLGALLDKGFVRYIQVGE